MVSLLAPPDQLQQARDIALKCVRSLKLKPKWIAYQHDMDREGLEYLRGRQGRRSWCWPSIQSQFESRMRAMQEEVNAFEQHQLVGGSLGQMGVIAQVLNGVAPTADPLATKTRSTVFHQ